VSSIRTAAIAIPAVALAVIGATLIGRPSTDEGPAAVVRATNPVLSLPATTSATPAATTATTITSRATTATTNGVTTTVARAGRTSFALGTSLAPLGGDADAWTLEPSSTARATLEKVGAALHTADPTRFEVTPTTWRYEVPATSRPVPFLCVNLDLNDPRAFPRCQQAIIDEKLAWRGGTKAVAKAEAIWTAMGYDLAQFQVEPAVDDDGYVVAHLLLGGVPVRHGLKLRFEDTVVQAAEGLTVTPRAVPARRISTAEAMSDLQRDGFAELRSAAGAIDATGGLGPARATVVAVEPALLALASTGGSTRLYAVPAYAFVGADGTRFVVAAVATDPVWDPPAATVAEPA
jgi:hypothetical protein